MAEDERDQTQTSETSAVDQQTRRHLSDLQKRVISGAVYFAVSAACAILSKWTTLALVVATVCISASEFYSMLRSDAKLPNELLGIIGAALYPISVFFLGLEGALLVTVVLLVALLIWYVFYMRSRTIDVGVSLFGAAYIGLLLSGIVLIRDALPDLWGGLFVFGILLSVWANDAFAFLFGSRFGKHKLAPRISPNKSWEGFLAGLGISMITWLVMSFLPCTSMNIWEGLIFGLICGLAGVLGDLVESRIKRNAGVKDSGTILPGHGGLLDRSDSLFLVAPVAAFLLLVFGCI